MLQGSQARQGSGTPRQRIQPGRWLYIVAAAALALGTLLGVLSLVGLVSALSGSTTKVVAPGETEITLPAAGAYTINYEYQTVVDGRTFNTPPEFPSMKLELISTTSGTHVPIRASSVQSTYEVGSTKGAAIGEFTVDRPGTYVLTSQYSGGETTPEVVLAIGRGSPGTVLFTIFGIFGAIGLLLVSLVIGLATLILRMTAKQRVRSAGMLTAPAEASGGVSWPAASQQSPPPGWQTPSSTPPDLHQSPPHYSSADAPPPVSSGVLPPPQPGSGSPAVASEVRPTPPAASWALGLGIASIPASLLGPILLAIFPIGQLWVLFLLAPLLGVPALVFGIRSQRQIARSHGALRGRGTAIGGWICGLCGLAIDLLLFLSILLVVNAPTDSPG